jgi:hypothetical protein
LFTDPLNFAPLSVCEPNVISGGQAMLPCCHRRCVYSMRCMCAVKMIPTVWFHGTVPCSEFSCIWERTVQLEGEKSWKDLWSHS